MTTPQILPERNLGRSNGPVAHAFLHANPLDPDLSNEILTGEHFVVWAGWLDESGDPSSANFPSDHRLWTEGITRLRGALVRIARVLEEREAILSLRPACGLVLSDPHSIAALLKDSLSDRLRILVDPVAMMTPGMAERAEDHLPRMLDKLGAFEACCGVVLAGGDPAGEDRLGHLPLDPSREFDRTILSAWRNSVFVEREVFVLTKACSTAIVHVRSG